MTPTCEVNFIECLIILLANNFVYHFFLQMDHNLLSWDDDIMAHRRLKNRERQRRYRAKKRLEADMLKLSMLAQSSKPSSSQATGVASPFAAFAVSGPIERVHCGRKWKKDARRAHISEELASLPRLPALLLRSPVQTEAGHKCSSQPTTKRQWKMEARNKMAAT